MNDDGLIVRQMHRSAAPQRTTICAAIKLGRQFIDAASARDIGVVGPLMGINHIALAKRRTHADRDGLLAGTECVNVNVLVPVLGNGLPASPWSCSNERCISMDFAALGRTEAFRRLAVSMTVSKYQTLWNTSVDGIRPRGDAPEHRPDLFGSGWQLHGITGYSN